MTPDVLDLIIAVVILLSTFIAYYRGLIREVFTIVGLGAAVFGAYAGGHLLIPYFNKWLDVPEDGGDRAAKIVTEGVNEAGHTSEAMQAALHKEELIFGILSPGLAAQLCAYGAMFLAVFIIVGLVSYFISRQVDEMGLGIVDKILGAGFGFARGFLIVFLLYVPWTFLIDQDKFPSWAKNSLSVPILNQTLVYVDERFEFSKKIEDRGGDIAIRIGKVDPDKIGEEDEAEIEKKKAIVREIWGDDEPPPGADDGKKRPSSSPTRQEAPRTGGYDSYFQDPEAELQHELSREEMQRNPEKFR